MNVYFRSVETGKLGMIKVSGEENFEEARLLAKEHLVEGGEGYNEPILAVIDGGEQ